VILDIGGMVLAGGGGLRLGREKALENLGERSLLEWVLLQLGFLDSDILLVTARGLSYPWLEGYSRLKVVSDIYPGKGPLGGIYTGLKLSDSFYSLVVACDMPFLNRALLGYMVGVSIGYDLVLPRLKGLVEPLLAVYSKACLAPIERLLKQGTLGVRELFRLVRVRYIEAEEIDQFDPEHLSFFNINTRSDLTRAKDLLRVKV
jgi:molybdopterin-guanine dinucleotide biosynthesis protein A